MLTDEVAWSPKWMAIWCMVLLCPVGLPAPEAAAEDGIVEPAPPDVGQAGAVKPPAASADANELYNPIVLPRSEYVNSVVNATQTKVGSASRVWMLKSGNVINELLVPAEYRYKPIKLRSLMAAAAQAAEYKLYWIPHRPFVVQYPVLDNGEVKSLLALMGSDESKKRIRGAWSAGASYDPSLVEPLLELAADPGTAEGACASLERYGWEVVVAQMDGRALPALQHRIKSGQKLGREPAIFALGWIEDKKALEELQALAQNPDPGIRRAAAIGLSRRGSDATVDLIALTGDTDPEVARYALLSLGNFPSRTVAATLRKFETSQQPGLREAAFSARCDSEREKAEAIALEGMQDQAPEMRVYALAELSEIGSPAAVAAIHRALADSAPAVRVAALRALSAVGNAEDLPAFQKQMADLDEVVRHTAWSGAPAVAGDAAAPQLGQVLADCTETSDPGTIFVVATALGNCGGLQATAQMKKLAQHSAKAVRSAVTAQAFRLERNAALALLEKGLDDLAPVVRCAAVDALGRIPGDESIKLLDRALKDPSEDVQARVAGALVYMGTPSALGHLVKLAAEAKGRTKADFYFVGKLADVGGLRAQLVFTLGALGNSPASRGTIAAFAGQITNVEPATKLIILEQLIIDPSDYVRVTAARSLVTDLGLAGRKVVLAHLPNEKQMKTFQGMVSPLREQYPQDAELEAALKKIPPPKEE